MKTGGFLTGTTITRTTGANLSSNGVSMDQLCARKIGNLTPLPSLELGIEPPATGVDSNVGYTQLYGAHISWSTPMTPLPRRSIPGSPSIACSGPRAAAGDRALAATRDRSVLDLVSDDARRLQQQLGANDREKLDEYLESVRSVERRIEFDAKRQQQTVHVRPAGAHRDRGARPAHRCLQRSARVSERTGDHTEHVRLMIDMMALAFWTDSTRVATFMFGNAVSSRSFSFLGEGFGGHHQTSHHEDKAEKLAQYQQINIWHLEQYAYLLEKLKSIHEGDADAAR